jgi:hypothetical protein
MAATQTIRGRIEVAYVSGAIEIRYRDKNECLSKKRAHIEGGRSMRRWRIKLGFALQRINQKAGQIDRQGINQSTRKTFSVARGEEMPK